MDPGSERRLAAILFTDIVGSTAVTARSESAGLALRDRHRELVRTQVQRYQGRFIEAPGDESLSTFESAVDAVHAALAIQQELDGDAELKVRIGIHLGETIFRGDEVFGDGVNIAARVRELAEPRQILASAEVARAVQNQPNVETSARGEHKLKGVEGSVMVHAISGTAVEPSVGPAAAEPKRAAARWLVPAGAIALVAAVALAWWLFGGTTPSSGPIPQGTAPPPGAEVPVDEAQFTVPGFGDVPAIAVLAFDNLSGDPEQEYFADGIAEDLITRLSALAIWPIISRNSSFTYKGQAVDMKQVGQELGARYIIEGSVRKAASRVRISVQLIDTETDHHVWAETYDRELRDIFAVQDEITESIIGSLRPKLWRTEVERAARHEPREFGAYDLVQRAWWHGLKNTQQDTATARSFAEHAIELDPSYAPAWHTLAYSHYADYIWQWTDSPERTLQALERAARKSVALDSSSTSSHLVLANFYQATSQTEEQIAALRHAVGLDPSSAVAHSMLGGALNLRMRPDEAFVHLEKALRLDPKSPTRWGVLQALASAHYTAKQYDASLDYARQAVRLKPDNHVNHLYVAMSYVGLGRLDEARAATGEAVRARPDLTLAVVRENVRRFNVHPDLGARWVADCRTAGLTE